MELSLWYERVAGNTAHDVKPKFRHSSWIFLAMTLCKIEKKTKALRKIGTVKRCHFV